MNTVTIKLQCQGLTSLLDVVFILYVCDVNRNLSLYLFYTPVLMCCQCFMVHHICPTACDESDDQRHHRMQT